MAQRGDGLDSSRNRRWPGPDGQREKGGEAYIKRRLMMLGRIPQAHVETDWCPYRLLPRPYQKDRISQYPGCQVGRLSTGPCTTPRASGSWAAPAAAGGDLSSGLRRHQRTPGLSCIANPSRCGPGCFLPAGCLLLLTGMPLCRKPPGASIPPPQNKPFAPDRQTDRQTDLGFQTRVHIAPSCRILSWGKGPRPSHPSGASETMVVPTTAPQNPGPNPRQKQIPPATHRQPRPTASAAASPSAMPGPDQARKAQGQTTTSPEAAKVALTALPQHHRPVPDQGRPRAQTMRRNQGPGPDPGPGQGRSQGRSQGRRHVRA